MEIILIKNIKKLKLYAFWECNILMSNMLVKFNKVFLKYMKNKFDKN